MITLYDMPLSGNCHKVRLLLSLLALPYQARPVDLLGGEQRSSNYLQSTRSARCRCWMTMA